MRRLACIALLVVAGCGKSGVTQQSGAAACITAAACGMFPTGGVSACTQVIAFVNDLAIAAGAHINADEVNCIAAAGHDCVAARKCLAGGMTPTACSGNTKTCAGNVLQQCTTIAGTGAGNMGVQTFDCASVGEMCVANSNNNVDCGFGSCQPGSAASCVTPDGNAGGSLVQACSAQGILQRQDCTRYNATCNPSGTAHCRGNGAPCSRPSLLDDTLRCDGSKVVHCLDGQEGAYDCAQDNLGCFPNPNGAAGFSCAAGNACDPNTYTATCMGTVLKFCNKGLEQTADCAAAGFSVCTPNNGGACMP